MFRLEVILFVSLSILFSISLASSSPTEDDIPFQTSDYPPSPMIEEEEELQHFQRDGYKWDDKLVDDPAFVQDFHAKDYGKPLPVNFDAREVWSNCPTIRQIADQGDCQSCWAVVSADVIRDRMCIEHANMTSYTASASEFMNCVPKSDHDACQPLNSLAALRYFVEQGIVTGGPYGSGIGCKPYPIHPHVSAKGVVPSDCASKCANPAYPISYPQDKKFGKNARGLKFGPNIVEDIQHEIFKNGPVVASFKSYKSFHNFWNRLPSDAVYRKDPNEPETKAGHAVRVIGWGTTADGTKFWTFLNSWGNHTGRHGVGRFLRGNNECGFEDQVTTVDV